MARIQISVDVKDVVVVDGNHGGYLTGRCSACGARGWLDGYGYPARAKDVKGSHLQHRKGCPMNRHVKDDGSLKRARKRA